MSQAYAGSTRTGFAGRYNPRGDSTAWRADIGSDPSHRERTLARLDRLSRLLDVAFTVPGTRIRFGVDAIVGLVPGIGDAAGTLLSTIIIVEAFRLGAPATLLGRMAVNVAIEFIVGSVPVAGDLFDVFWRANRRNMALLRRHFDQDSFT